ncbi:hypothetical protein Taro_011898 [Colocasia esculenta]|uniref:NPH3 domain-containing protein n=1 Tax=Colocasia esculenta TaxID=4460 RepID=A0A843UHH5_COLES|nr:hypothetical protein [Colocasia esculenta]
MFTEDPPPDFQVLVHGVLYTLNKRCVALRSAKMARLLEARSQQRQLLSLADIPADEKAFMVATRFCYGYEPDLSTENVVPIACVASFLEMTEEHSKDNLLGRALGFISARVLSHWNETLRALRSAEIVLPHAAQLGIVDACLRSIAEKALADPHLLRNPMEDLAGAGSHGDADRVVIGVKRRLFLVDWRAEDLTGLGLDLYVPAMAAMACAGVPEEHLALCLYRYARKRANVGGPAPPDGEVGSSEYEKINQMRVMEAVEKLLPQEKGALPVKCLFEMLRSAIFLRASHECRSGLEARIGKLLPEASLEDLLIPSSGYARETKYDFDCIQRLLTHFCSNCCADSRTDLSKLVTVTRLFEGFLAEVAKDAEMKKEKFVPLLEMLASLLEGIRRGSDGVYCAVDAYFLAHGHLTESEREEVCRALDCRGLSLEACEHASQNARMPLRMVARALFIGQMHIRQAMACALRDSDGRASEKGKAKEEKYPTINIGGRGTEEEERDENQKQQLQQGMEARKEILSVRSRVTRPEATRSKTMREPWLCCRCGGLVPGMVRKKLGFWKGLRWKLGCRSGLQGCKCNVKRMHPKKNNCIS